MLAKQFKGLKITQNKTDLVDELLDDYIIIEPVRNSRLVDISVESHDAALSADIANTLAGQYIDQNMELNLFASKQAGSWLLDRIGELRKKVEVSELALQKYKEQTNILSLEKRQSIILQKVSEINTKVIEAKTNRIELETRYQQLAQLSKHPGMIESLPAVINNELIREVKSEYVKSQREYSDLSKRYKHKHPKIIRSKSQVELLKNKIALEVDKIVNSIKIEYEVAKSREKSLDNSLDVLKKEALKMNQKGIKYGVLNREVNSNKEMYNILLKRLKETNLSGGLKNSNIRVIDIAEMPILPIRPNIGLNLLLALALGSITGIGMAFFFEYMDNTVKSAEDIERFIKLPLLGSISIIKQKNGNQPEKIAALDSKSTISEAYRALRTGVIFSSTNNQHKTLLITSAEPREGKTVTACNLAITMAQMGSKVLLIDSDMRKPRLHKVFGVDNSVGLSSLLVGQSSLHEAVYQTQISNLMILPCGPIPPNPSELLVSKGMQNLIKELKGKFDRIILDSPPTVAVTDSTILSNICDQLLLVVSCGKTTREVISRCKKLLSNKGAQLLGIVLNNFDIKHRDHYYSKYYYYYNYSYENNGRKKKRRPRRKAEAVG